MRFLVSALLAAVSLSAADSALIGGSINDSTDAIVAPGWPVLLGAKLVHPQYGDASATPISVPRGAIMVDIRNAAGDTVNWPLEPVPGQDTLVVDAGHVAVVRWTMSADAVANLDRGDYKVIIRIGGTDSDTKTMTVTVAEKSDQPESERLLATAKYWWWRDNMQTALSTVQDLLTREPDNVSALILQGDLQASSGDSLSALNSYSHALSLVMKQKEAANEVPELLIQRRNAMLAAIANQGAPNQ